MDYLARLKSQKAVTVTTDKADKRASVSFVSTEGDRVSPLWGDDHIPEAEFLELRNLLHRLAHIDGWQEQELADLLDEADHMAHAGVRAAIKAAKELIETSPARWPNRAPRLTLCRARNQYIIDLRAANDSGPEAA